MTLYVNGERVKIYVNGLAYNINLVSPVVETVGLLSSDGYILQDKNGLYLIPRGPILSGMILSSDSYILQDKNGLYITIKED